MKKYYHSPEMKQEEIELESVIALSKSEESADDSPVLSKERNSSVESDDSADLW